MIETALYDIFGEMPSLRMQKCKLIYHLARTAKAEGSFVDLGVWHGYSTISMIFGSMANDSDRRVYAVDDFTDRKGWARETYSPDDLTVFHQNLTRAKLVAKREGLPYFTCVHLRTDVQWSASNWPDIPVALLHWDLGCDNRLEEDLRAWLPHLVRGCQLAIHDTMEGRFGSDGLLKELQLAGLVSGLRQAGAGLRLVEVT